MKEEAKQLIETIASHPKTAIAIAAASNTNVWWLDYGEPTVKIVTSLLGMAILVVLLVKHTLDIKKEHFTK